jgi:hypothetical protein
MDHLGGIQNLLLLQPIAALIDGSPTWQIYLAIRGLTHRPGVDLYSATGIIIEALKTEQQRSP